MVLDNARETDWSQGKNPYIDGGGWWGVFNTLVGWQNVGTLGSIVSYIVYWIFVMVSYIVMLIRLDEPGSPSVPSKSRDKISWRKRFWFKSSMGPESSQTPSMEPVTLGRINRSGEGASSGDSADPPPDLHESSIDVHVEQHDVEPWKMDGIETTVGVIRRNNSI